MEHLKPPSSSDFDLKLVPENSNFVSLGDGEKQIFLVDIFGKDELKSIVENKSYIIVAFHNPSDEEKSIEFKMSLEASNWARIVFWLIVVGSILGFIALLSGVMMICKKYRKKDKLGFHETVLVKGIVRRNSE